MGIHGPVVFELFRCRADVTVDAIVFNSLESSPKSKMVGES